MSSQISLPIPISYIAGRYLLFSIDTVTYLRREYNICGVLIGTLPQIPQQNVFLGLPLELMPEEARVLVDSGVACIVDEAKAHDGMKYLLEEDRLSYMRELESQGLHAMRILTDRKDQQREQTLKKISDKKSKANAEPVEVPATADDSVGKQLSTEKETSSPEVDLFGDSPARDSMPQDPSNIAPVPQHIMGITPATSYPPLEDQIALSKNILSTPSVPPSYPLFAHLHSQGYFLSPGLRFGCQYVAYPGDPLRFHSHFLVVSAEWDQDIDLMDIVIGGRLGTGVKKAFLLGGPQKAKDESTSEIERTKSVRSFSIEWAGM